MSSSQWEPIWETTKKKVIDNKFCFAKDINQSGKKNYCFAPSREVFLNWADKMPDTEKNFYEIIKKDDPRKFYADVELAGDMLLPLEEWNLLLDQIKERTMETATKMYPDIPALDKKTFAVLSSTREGEKQSAHIILTQGMVFETKKAQDEFIKEAFPRSGFKIEEGETPPLWLNKGFDHSVYSCDQLFRIKGSTKKGQNRHFKLTTKELTETDKKIVNLRQIIEGAQNRLSKVAEGSEEETNLRREIALHSDEVGRVIDGNDADDSRYVGFSDKDLLITCMDTFKGSYVQEKKKIKVSKADKKIVSDEALEHKEDMYDLVLERLFNKYPIWVTDYDKWIELGLRLYTAGGTLNNWLIFSAYSKKDFNKQESKEKWRTFQKEEQGSSSSLIKWLKWKDPDLTADIKNTNLDNLEGRICDVAIMLAHLYGEEHVYSENRWWYKEKVLWKEDKDQIEIGKKLMQDFQRDLEKYYNGVTKLEKSTDAEKAAKYPNRSAEWIATHLENRKTAAKKSMEMTGSGALGDMRPLKIQFSNRAFYKNLDSQPNIIAFENGIYDLLTHERREPHCNEIVDDIDNFEPTIVNEYVSLSTGYEFFTKDEVKAMPSRKINGKLKSPWKDSKEPAIASLDIYLDQLFPDPEVRKFTLLCLAATLCGKDNEQRIIFWTGVSNSLTGANGKSTFINLLRKVFGGYCAEGHGALLTAKKEAPNGSNEALMHLKGKRFVFFQEPETDRAMNIALVKNMTGGDQIICRGNYDKGMTSYKPMWHMFCCCNGVPGMSQDDGGARRRIVAQPYESKFVPPEDMERYEGVKNVHPQNPNVERTIDKGSWRLPMMWILLEHWKEYQKMIENGESLILPKKIKTHTDNYFKEQSIVEDWLQSLTETDMSTIKDPSKSGWILTEAELRANKSPEISKAYRTFSQLRQLLENNNHLGKQTEIAKINGIEYKKFWRGHRLINSDRIDGSENTIDDF